MFFVQCIRNSRKNKNRQPIRAAVFNPPAEIYSVSFLTAHRRKLSFPIKGTLALHCQVARLVSESFLMLVRIVSSLCPGATKFCVIAHNLRCRPRAEDAIGYAKFHSRSHDAVIRVYDEAGNVIETQEHAGDFKEP